MLAADVPSALVVSLLALAAAAVTAGVTLVTKLRESQDKKSQDAQTRELGLIHQTQDSLIGLIETQRAEIAVQRAEITELRAQVAAMRLELAEALQHHAECEEARASQDLVIAALRARLPEARRARHTEGPT